MHVHVRLQQPFTRIPAAGSACMSWWGESSTARPEFLPAMCLCFADAREDRGLGPRGALGVLQAAAV